MHLSLGFVFVVVATLLLRSGHVAELSRDGMLGFALGEVAGVFLWFFILNAILFYATRWMRGSSGRTYATARTSYAAAALLVVGMIGMVGREMREWRYEVGKADDQTPLVGAVTREPGSGKILSVACQDGIVGVLTTTDQPIGGEDVDVTYQIDGQAKISETWVHTSGRVLLVGDAARVVIDRFLQARTSINVRVADGRPVDFSADNLSGSVNRVLAVCGRPLLGG